VAARVRQDQGMADPSPPLIGVTIDCPDPETVARFWQEFLGYERRPDQPHEVDGQHVSLFKPSGVPGLHHVTFQRVQEPKVGKARAHLDLWVQHAAPIFERMLAAGATPVETRDDPPVVSRVLRDPAGNEFCLIGRD
jgi:catechol 2,3-dioxygenase-like lactoylglutathione lyase family enzyme